MKESSIKRIQEICSYYEQVLSSYRSSGEKLNSSNRHSINTLRQECLNEICQLIKN